MLNEQTDFEEIKARDGHQKAILDQTLHFVPGFSSPRLRATLFQANLKQFHSNYQQHLEKKTTMSTK